MIVSTPKSRISGKKRIIAEKTPASKTVPTQAKIVAVIVNAERETTKNVKRYKKKTLKISNEKPKTPRFTMSIIKSGKNIEALKRVAPEIYLPKKSFVRVIPRL